MFFIMRRRIRAEAGTTRRHNPRLEVLEDRTLLTLFTVSAVPDSAVFSEATASVTYTPGPNQVVRTSLAGDASPAGMGDHRGQFYLGPQTDLLQIDTAPEAGQHVGDPIRVAFLYSYTSRLQNFDGYPPPYTGYVEWHGFLDAGDATQPLFDGLFSTDFITGDEIHDQQLIRVNMNVGDSIIVHVWSNGDAYAAEPHFRDQVSFNADFTVSDFIHASPLPVHAHTIPVSLLSQDSHASWSNPTFDSAQHPAASVDLNALQWAWVLDGAGLQESAPNRSQRPPRDNLPVVHSSVNPAQNADVLDALV
jgi:hypothetical protein